MKKTLLILIVSFCIQLSAQKENLWKKVDEKAIAGIVKVDRNSTPSSYQIFSLDLDNFKTQLANIAVRGSYTQRSSDEISLPNADGKIERYHVIETPIMEPGLAAKFPMIKSYAAQGIDDPTAVARFTVTQFGLHSMTMSVGKSTVFIDPYSKDRKNYIVYKRTDSSTEHSAFECLTDDMEFAKPENNPAHDVFNTDDSTLRTYRLALSCTAEYGNIFAGTGTVAQQKANIQAQMAITMTRVNGIYEIDFGITMIFVANNDTVIYLGSVTADPWSNEWNTKTAQTIDAAIGVNNYDIGHNFNTTGGGNAGCIACVCKSTSQSGAHKGRGYTGSTNPTGDAFDIDYVAHEMGHQFGGYHTQSSSGCRSGSGQTEVEPGSASTIMGYAGICPANVQNNSDAYFAYVNIRDIMAYVKSTTGSCSVNTPVTNLAPEVSAGADYTIPKSTAFILTAEGSDPDGDILTYCWEQRDPEDPNTTAAPVPTRVLGPMFRSVSGAISPSRYMPDLATVLTGAVSNTWEVVPSVARTMNFSVVARDNVAGNGQTASDLMLVTVSGTAGPFILNAPNTNVSWPTGSNQNVTWDVSGTTANGVNTQFVDIYMSSDGGNSFPILLAAKVPNDGTETVSIPNVAGTQNRIMVRGYNHIFYDVSNTNFTVNAASPTFALSFNGQPDGQNKSVCQGTNAVYDLSYTTIGGFSTMTTFSATGNPSGTTVSFSPSSVNSTGTVTMTVSGTAGVAPGLYTILVTGTAGATTKTVNLYLEVLNAAFATLQLTSPADLANGLASSVLLEWEADPAAASYDVVVATDIDFDNIIISENTASNNYQLTGLTDNTNYFWKVLPKNQGCQGAFSAVFRFTTGDPTCTVYVSTNVPISISATGTPTVNSVLTVPVQPNATVSKVTVTLNVSHTYISDLTATLISPTGTQVELFATQCGDQNNANATFDDGGIAFSCTGATPAITGNMIPAQALSAFIGEVPSGQWTLRIFDGFNADGGTLNSWQVNICTVSDMPITCGQITSTWNGTSWSNGRPVSNVAAVINGSFNTGGDMEACSLNINGTAQVTVSSGDNLIVGGAVTVAPTAGLTIQNNANLIQIDNVANSGNSTVFRNSNPLMRLDYTMWSSPVSGTQTLKDFSSLTLNNRFYNYDTQNNVFAVVPDPLSTVFQSGKGYLIRMPDNHPVTPTIYNGSFNGVLNNGLIAVPLNYFGAGQGFNMIGNPYPSTIDADLFLQANSAMIDGTLYFWRKTNAAAGTAYASYTLGGATTTSPTSPLPNGIIQVGQGFIVGAKNVANPTATFTNSQRTDDNNNQFFRTHFGLPFVTKQIGERHRIWLNLTSDTGFFSQMMVGYIENATDATDELIDGKYIGDSPIALTSTIDGAEFSVQGKALPFENTDIVPLLFRNDTSGNYTIAIDHVDGLFESGQDIFLKDNLNGIVHNLTSDYNFSAGEGVFDNRFQLVYQQTLNTDSFNTSNDVVAITGNNQIGIRSTSQNLVNVTVYDVLGRLLSNHSEINNKDLTIDTISPSGQMLLLKIILTDGKTAIRKIQF